MHSGLANSSFDLKTFQLESSRNHMHSGLDNGSFDLETFQLESLRKRMHSGLANGSSDLNEDFSIRILKKTCAFRTGQQ